MALSTQSLASVTYQVRSLATAFLRLLDLQAAQLRRVEADIACVAQSVDMHKEKVSRREIGALTVTRRFLSYQKVVAPPNPPVLEPYYRKPLNFSVLDDIGHGIKVSTRGPTGGLGGSSLSPVSPALPEGRTGGSDPSSMGHWGLSMPTQLWHPTEPFPAAETPQEGFGGLRAPRSPAQL
ncbi:hypothetical protein DV515_00019562 [Chloebia gouldiae]|uniref:Abl-interactor homeo-domain homologous domain-containing protein n=1 Tax=Chloebia gouldiae TaxID=44316 RepID=A0A3L8Q4D0_CHLGU|nr:hypothetical protein DV515_00019562 [Chloebia gouldiae]